MTIHPQPQPTKVRTITTNRTSISRADALRYNGYQEPQQPPEPKSNLVILAVAALILGFILVFIGSMATSLPFYACGFATILTSNVLAILSLRE